MRIATFTAADPHKARDLRYSAKLTTSSIPELPNLIESISRRFQSHTPRRLDVEHSGRAAVLIPLLPQGEEFCFLLTQRTDKVETHKGQISFPGGLYENSNRNLLQTALPETWEEIGLARCPCASGWRAARNLLAPHESGLPHS